jgi:hypothetical protein
MKTTKTSKTMKTTKTSKAYAVESIGMGMPKRIGDLYPTRAAAESYISTLPFTSQWCTQIVEISL